MAEQVIKKYFCDFCGAEIDQRSESAIRCFEMCKGNQSFTIKQLPQMTDASRQVYVMPGSGDFCNVDHFAKHIKKQMDYSRGRVASDKVDCE